MIVLMLERVSASVRGELTRWLLEPRTGVFVGNVSAAVRDKLWELACEKMVGDGAGMLIHNAQNEQGFAIRFYGNTSRQVEDFDGMFLIRVPTKSKESDKG